MRILTIRTSGIPSGQTNNLISADVLQDYDAIIVNPEDIEELYPLLDMFLRGVGRVLTQKAGRTLKNLSSNRLSQVQALLQKGGVIVCFMHAVHVYHYNEPASPYPTYITNYDWLFDVNYLKEIGGINYGTGTTLQQLDPSSPFFTYLNTKPKWTAYANKEASEVAGWKVIASAFGTHSLAMSKKVYNGYIVLLPSSYNPKNGELLEKSISNLLSEKQPIPAPKWSRSISVPGQEQHITAIKALDKEIAVANKKRDDLLLENNALERWKLLLYGTGKEYLEPVVREAFSLLGFDVEKQPDKDSDGKITCQSGICLLEVEGAKETIKIEKASQLLRNIANFLVSKQQSAKGVLVGNAFRDEPPNNRPPEGSQKRLFSKELLDTANQQNITVLLSTDLFEVVCRILSGQMTQSQKETLQKKIYNSKGLTRLFKPAE